MSLGEFSLALGAASSESEGVRLERVERHLHQSAKWYEDRDVGPGDWVQFEAKLNYAATSLESGQVSPGDDGPLIFWEPALPAPTVEEVMARRRDPPTLLMLHATADGLIDGQPKHFCQSADSSDDLPTIPINYTKEATFFEFIRRIAQIENEVDVSHATILDRITSGLDIYVPPFAASWLGGVARVTMRIPSRGLGIWRVVGTPLFVERISAPEQDG
jgi:hypothetical protein